MEVQVVVFSVLLYFLEEVAFSLRSNVKSGAAISAICIRTRKELNCKIKFQCRSKCYHPLKFTDFFKFFEA